MTQILELEPRHLNPGLTSPRQIGLSPAIGRALLTVGVCVAAIALGLLVGAIVTETGPVLWSWLRDQVAEFFASIQIAMRRPVGW